tara:strand:+ start:818 stop:1021 length:204 start_codon:yes stop_codon:yes gene_type:complete
MKWYLNIIITNTKSKYMIRTYGKENRISNKFPFDGDSIIVYKKLFPYVFIKHRVFDDLDKAIEYINQ